MGNENASAQVPMDVLLQLQGAAKQLGIDLPGIVRFAPTIDIGMDIRALALELGRLLARQNIYLRPDDTIVTVDSTTGIIQPMKPTRFVGWAEEFCAFRTSGRSQRVRNSLSREDAATILDQDIFKGCLRPLDAVHTMRLPVKRPGLGLVEFLEPGYDAESRIFTADVIKYEMDWPVDRAREFLFDVFHEFPWNGLEGLSGEARIQALQTNRSFAVHVAAMLGTYCRALFPAGTLRPMFAYFANKPGSGKTRLAESALSHVFGFVGGTAAPKDEEKMDVKLETVARAMRPFVIFDDVGGGLRSNSLNKFITETMHTGRCYNSNSEFFEVPNVTQVFVTANELPTSEDLGRRALIAEFFLAEEVRGRKFKRSITPRWLAMPETRAQFLSSLCAIVKHWLADACEAASEGKPAFMHDSPLETFEDWTALIGGMVMCASFGDPLAMPERDVGGAGQEDEIKQLLVEVASNIEDAAEWTKEPFVVTREDLAAKARTMEILDGLVGAQGDEPMDATANKRFGKRMQRWRGQHLRDKHGRLFVFSHKKKKTGATYPLLFMKPAA